MTGPDILEGTILASLQNEFPAERVVGLRFYSYQIKLATRRVELRAYFERAPSDDTKDLFRELNGILSTHLPDGWSVATQFLDTDEGEHPGPGDRMWYPIFWCRLAHDESVSALTVRYSIEVDWPEQPVQPLLAFSFHIDPAARRVWFKALIERKLSEDEWDDVDNIMTDLFSHVPDDWAISMLYGCQPKGPFFNTKDTVVFRRGDPVTPLEKGKARWALQQLERGGEEPPGGEAA